MSNRFPELFLFDILVAIVKIEQVLSIRQTLDELESDFMAWDSVMREFEIIGEATNLLIKENYLSCEFRPIVDFRNRIIHHYFGIDPLAVWEVVIKHLPVFKNVILSKTKELPQTLFSEILSDTCADLSRTPLISEQLQQLLKS